MSGFWDDFFGKSQQEDIRRGAADATAYVNQGRDSGIQNYEKYGQQAAGRLDPYAQAGTGFIKRYADAMGINGADAQRTVQSEYMHDPIQNALMDRITRANTRAQVANGTGNSGAATQSLTNALLSRWDDYTKGLSSGGAMGMQAATGQAGIDQATGSQIGDAYIGAANQNAAIRTGEANAMAASRSTGINNLFKVASLGVQGFTAFKNGGGK